MCVKGLSVKSYEIFSNRVDIVKKELKNCLQSLSGSKYVKLHEMLALHSAAAHKPDYIVGIFRKQ